VVKISYITLLLLSIFSSLLLSPTALALTQLVATVDRNPVMEKESFVLTITADDDIDTNALDTSPLLKDFIVGRTSVSSQTSMINFNTTRTTKWTTVLIPRKAGKIVIPTLEIDSFSTNAINLDVVKSNSQSGTKSQDIFITSKVSSKEIYVQQQLTLTVKLHFATELKRGNLTEPVLAGSNITQIGKDKESDNIINGRRYRVIERNYAVSPQKSGEFVLQTPMFSGEVLAQSNRRTNFLSFAETKPVSVLGEDINLSVKPIPDSYQGFWLPTEILTLHQEWQPDAESFKVGEPITRTITLTAAGLSEEQLPDIKVSMPKGIKIYPDQAELHTGMNQNRLVSQKKQNFALVASKAGTYELPEITIPWWNTVTNKLQHATIPAKTITILPNDDFDPSPITPSIQAGNTTETSAVETIIIKESSWLQWLFLALWLLTSFAWLLTSILNKKTPAAKMVSPKKSGNTFSSLSTACKNNQGDKVLILLVDWAKEQYPSEKISTLDDVVKVINSTEFTSVLNELQQSFYGKNITPWIGDNILNIINEIHKTTKNSSSVKITLNP